MAVSRVVAFDDVCRSDREIIGWFVKESVISMINKYL